MQKLGIKIRIKPIGTRIDKLLSDFKILLDDCLQETQRRYALYQQIDNPEKKPCNSCNEDKKLYWKNEQHEICNTCFLKTWSEYTLWSDYHKTLENKYPIFSGNKGYYNGAISNSVQVFKSYLEKKKKRDYEIGKKKEEMIILEGEIVKLEDNISILKRQVKNTKDLNITDKLAKSEKELKDKQLRYRRVKKRRLSPITFPKFMGNVAYMGNQNMFKFIPDMQETHKILKEEFKENKYLNLREELSNQVREGDLHNSWQLQLTNPYEKNGKWIFELLLGRKNYYQKTFILDCIEKVQWKVIRAKIQRQDNKYYLVFPARVLEEKCVELSKEFEKNKAKDVTFCSLSFGLNPPISLVAIKDNKPIKFKTFGNGYPLWRSERETLLKAKINKRIHLRHSKMEHFFNVSKKEIEKSGDCFGIEFDMLEKCPNCKVPESCQREFKRLMNEIYPLKDEIHSKKIKKFLRRERARFVSRHSNKHKRNALTKILRKKIGNRLANFKNYYDHVLSFEVVDFCNRNFKNVIFVFRDTKGIKSISYPSYYRRKMKDWSINQQKLFITYKALIKGIGNIIVPYKQLSDMLCPKCGENLGKITTMKLNQQKIIKCTKCKFQDNLHNQDSFLIYNAAIENLKKD